MRPEIKLYNKGMANQNQLNSWHLQIIRVGIFVILFLPLLANENLKREVRLAPAGIDFSLGYSVYGQTVRFISSSQENFGFLVESSELAEMMKSQFGVIWDQSKKV